MAMVPGAAATCDDPADALPGCEPLSSPDSSLEQRVIHMRDNPLALARRAARAKETTLSRQERDQQRRKREKRDLRAEIRRLEGRCERAEASHKRLQQAFEERLRAQFTTLRALFGFSLEFEDEEGGKTVLVRLRPVRVREDLGDVSVVLRTRPDGRVMELADLSQSVRTERALSFLHSEDIPGFLDCIRALCSEEG
jgi:hypothetical protein